MVGFVPGEFFEMNAYPFGGESAEYGVLNLQITFPGNFAWHFCQVEPVFRVEDFYLCLWFRRDTAILISKN